MIASDHRPSSDYVLRQSVAREPMNVIAIMQVSEWVSECAYMCIHSAYTTSTLHYDTMELVKGAIFFRIESTIYRVLPARAFIRRRSSITLLVRAFYRTKHSARYRRRLRQTDIYPFVFITGRRNLNVTRLSIPLSRIPCNHYVEARDPLAYYDDYVMALSTGNNSAGGQFAVDCGRSIESRIFSVKRKWLYRTPVTACDARSIFLTSTNSDLCDQGRGAALLRIVVRLKFAQRWLIRQIIARSVIGESNQARNVTDSIWRVCLYVMNSSLLKRSDSYVSD